MLAVELGTVEKELVIVDDGSTDETAKRAREAGAMVVPIHGRPGLGKVFRNVAPV